jgi:hypothetical protein
MAPRGTHKAQEMSFHEGHPIEQRDEQYLLESDIYMLGGRRTRVADPLGQRVLPHHAFQAGPSEEFSRER